VQLIRIAAELQAGKDMADNELLNAPDFFIGAVANPNFQPLRFRYYRAPGMDRRNRFSMPLGWSDVVPDVLEQAEIQIKHN
jgi:hypothetical protein